MQSKSKGRLAKARPFVIALAIPVVAVISITLAGDASIDIGDKFSADGDAATVFLAFIAMLLQWYFHYNGLDGRIEKLEEGLSDSKGRVGNVESTVEQLTKTVDIHMDAIDHLLQQNEISNRLHHAIGENHEALADSYEGLSVLHRRISKHHSKFGENTKDSSRDYEEYGPKQLPSGS